MSLTRIYQAIPLRANEKIILDEKASHHVARVLRANIGDEMTLFNGKGGEYHAVIYAISKKSVEVSVQHFVAREAESPLNIYLAQGIARGEKMDFIVQKAVELGVTKIFPLITERCNVRLEAEREAKRLQHWQAITVSACEQSGRNQIPEICSPHSLESWVKSIKADVKLVLTPHENSKINKKCLAKSVALLIGPEGGLSNKEVELAQTFQFQPCCLGPRILRTETATISTLTAIQCFYGDF